MQPPCVVIAANPYEAELCRRALVDTGVRIVIPDGGDGALEAVRAERPLVLVVALGLVGDDPLALVRTARAELPTMLIFLIADREGEIKDEESAARLGATRLYLRPIDVEALADAIEKCVVAAEIAADTEAMYEFDVRPVTVDAAPLVEEEVVELEAEYEAAIPRQRTEVMGAAPTSTSTGVAAALDEPLLRADFLPDVTSLMAEPTPPEPAPASRRGARRSTMSRHLASELSAAERRLFPNTPPAQTLHDEDDDALLELDLDKLGLETIPGLGADVLTAALIEGDLAPKLGNGHRRPVGDVVMARRGAPPLDHGELSSNDIATLFAELCRAGFGGALTLASSVGEKKVYFDAGAPVAARSSLPADRLADQLLLKGSLTRAQYTRAQALDGLSGSSMARRLVELGLIKSSELFATVRDHVLEIVYSAFAWEEGTYRLTRDEPPAEERVRLGVHPLAIIAEGVRRKYSLERLTELVGPPETVLAPTTMLARALDDAGLSPPERAYARLVDGERTLAQLGIAANGARLGDSALYALAWTLVSVGAARTAGDKETGALVQAMPTLVTAPYSDRRARLRTHERTRDRDLDRAIDKERVVAKLAQVRDGDYFTVLGLLRDASAHEVGRAYHRLKREFAVERYPEPLRQEIGDALVEIGEMLDEAHRVLSDDDVRASYRAHLGPAQQ